MNEVMLGEYEVPDASRLLGALEKAAIAVRVDELDERHRINSRGAFGRCSVAGAGNCRFIQHITRIRRAVVLACTQAFAGRWKKLRTWPLVNK